MCTKIVVTIEIPFCIDTRGLKIINYNVASIIKDIQTFAAQSKFAHCFTGLEAAVVDVVIIDTLMFNVLLFS
jgi:hypothetical protein